MDGEIVFPENQDDITKNADMLKIRAILRSCPDTSKALSHIELQWLVIAKSDGLLSPPQKDRFEPQTGVNQVLSAVMYEGDLVVRIRDKLEANLYAKTSRKAYELAGCLED